MRSTSRSKADTESSPWDVESGGCQDLRAGGNEEMLVFRYKDSVIWVSEFQTRIPNGPGVWRQAFRKWLGHERGTLVRDPRDPLPLLLCEKAPFRKQEMGPHRTPNLLMSVSWTSSL